jgi:hypothetical protein
MKTPASPEKTGYSSPQNNGIFDPQITGSSIGEGSIKKGITGTAAPTEKCYFKIFQIVQRCGAIID